jgi:uncharacterized membrane protein YcaP (DUF421 family)
MKIKSIFDFVIGILATLIVPKIFLDNSSHSSGWYILFLLVIIFLAVLKFRISNKEK